MSTIYRIFFLLIFFFPYLLLFAFRYKSLEEPNQEDAINSREFWMLVGSLILVLSSLVIISIDRKSTRLNSSH